MSKLNSVAVFCGSAAGNDPAYGAAATALGAGLAADGIGLVYGGGGIGLMGMVAHAAHQGGGRVVGVMPEFLKQRELPQLDGGELIITDSMHSRKNRMFALSDAFVIMPGGLGTLDEMFEILTWRQLGLHSKPILICDILGSARAWVATMDAAVAAGFAKPEIRGYYEVLSGVPAVLARLRQLPASPEAGTTRL